MNTLLVALTACAIASSVAAQTAAPSPSPAERQRDVQMQKETTAQSKVTPKQNAEYKSKEGKQQLDSDLQKKATP